MSLPSTIRTLRLGVSVAEIADLEKITVDPQELQDQVDLMRVEAQRQGVEEEVSCRGKTPVDIALGGDTPVAIGAGAVPHASAFSVCCAGRA
jgi:hypothetical protein